MAVLGRMHLSLLSDPRLAGGDLPLQEKRAGDEAPREGPARHRADVRAAALAVAKRRLCPAIVHPDLLSDALSERFRARAERLEPALRRPQPAGILEKERGTGRLDPRRRARQAGRPLLSPVVGHIADRRSEERR